MVRSNLDNIPIYALPDGLEVKPVTSVDCRQVWEGMKQAYRKEPWFTESKFDDARFKQWIDSPDFSSELWQAAWDGDRIVGIVQNFVKKEENEAFVRRRGHTERIFVAPSWQRKGVARALISRSLGMLRDMGMEDATLDVTAENVSGALHLYESMGYRATNHFTFYRKSLPR
jgi:mycothiol synthase